jgi:glycosyltransferase involved in cell wall biosynthesis
VYVRGQDDLDDYFSKVIFKNAMDIFCVSPLFVEIIARYTSDSKIFKIKPMISFCLSDSIGEGKRNKEKECRVLFLGRVEKEKGIWDVLSSLQLLLNRGFSVTLDVVGGGSELEKCIEYCINNDIYNNVFFHGPVSETERIKSYYQGATLFVNASYSEGFPRTIYEAMLFKVPVITTFVGGIPGLMSDKTNCFKINCSNSVELADMILYVYENEDVSNAIVEKAYKLVCEELDDSKLSHSEALYNRIIGRDYVR